MNRNDANRLGLEISRAVTNAQNVASLMFVLEAQKDDTLLDDTTITEHADLFPAWDENWTGKRGAIVLDDGVLYKSIHDVGAGQNTKPSQTPSMWTKIGNPDAEYREWSQPIGQHDAYMKGDVVMYNGKLWVCDADNNVWTPGVYGWSLKQ